MFLTSFNNSRVTHCPGFPEFLEHQAIQFSMEHDPDIISHLKLLTEIEH